MTSYPRGLSALLTKMLDDEDPRVKMRAIVALLSADPSNSCRSQLRSLSMLGNVDERVMALNALAEVGDPDALVLFSTELDDEHAPIAVRCAAASALAACGTSAIPELITALAAELSSLKASAASALGKIGDASLPAVLGSLAELDSEEGALLALDQLSAWKEAGQIRKHIKLRVELSLRFEELRLAIHQNKNERSNCWPIHYKAAPAAMGLSH